MKTQKLNQLLLLMILVVISTFTACVEDDEFDIPNVNITEPELTGPIRTMGSLAGDLAQEQGNSTLDYDDENTTVSYTFNPNDEFIEGYVVSSDEGGNFFEEIIIQDRAENPTIGIKFLIDVNPLFTRYEVGRKVYINIKNLSVGITNGVLTLGVLNGSEVDKVPAPLETSTILRGSELATIVPLPMSFSEFSNGKTNMMVALNDVQFNRDLVVNNTTTYASEALDQFDGERLLEACNSSNTVIFSTSTFADFKGLPLPNGQGNMNAILTKNFFGDTFNVVINTPEDINFDDGTNRCDPIILSCGLASAAGTNTLFSDDFETQSTFSPISGNGWTNFSQEGTEPWEAYISGGTNASQGISARVGSFGSNDVSTISWLITPQIDLNANSNVVLEFETSNSFSDGSTMEVLFSKDWDGTTAGITNATWGIIEDAYVTQDSDFFGSWFDSGLVDLSCETGQIYIAFKYVGNDTPTNDFNGTYELDNIRISSN